MLNRDLFKDFDPCLDNLLEEDYAYYHDDDNYNDTLEEMLYPDVYKRKKPNGPYSWED